MIGRCEEFDRRAEIAPGAAAVEARWREHLAGCASCRQQVAAEALLRDAVAGPVPALSGDFDARLRGRLERRLAERRPSARRPSGLRPAALWTLGAYGTAAVAGSLLVLARLPWQSLAVPPELGVGLGIVALLSPLVLLDRLGLVQPPG